MVKSILLFTEMRLNMILGKKKLSEPVILADNSDADKRIREIEDLRSQYLNIPELTEAMDEDIRKYRAGETGEKRVLYKLKNSYMPMYIMRDMYFEYECTDKVLSGQIDFIVITRKLVLVIECKNYSKYIRIEPDGTFINTKYENALRTENGIDSPYDQNRIHLNLIRTIHKEKSTFLKKMKLKKNADSFYKSIIVFANDEVMIDKSKAPENIKSIVVRYDNLISYIEELNNNSEMPEMTDDEMKELAELFVSMSTENKKDYTIKYKMLAKDAAHKVKPAPAVKISKPDLPPKAEITQPEEIPEQKTYQCPFCGQDLKYINDRWTCLQHRSFYLKSSIFDRQMTEDDLVDLLTDGRTKEYEFTGNEGKKFRARIVVKSDELKTDWEYKKARCPFCKENLIHNEKGWKCKNHPNFNINSVICGHRMEESDIYDLMEKGRTNEYEFVDRNQNPFRARIVVDESECKTKWEYVK